MSTLSQEFRETGRMRSSEVSEEESSLAERNGLYGYSLAPGTWEAAAVISVSDTKHRANRAFLDTIKPIVFEVQSPEIWSFYNARNCEYCRPRVYLNKWENFAENCCSKTMCRYQYFNLYDPTGKFYHMRSLDEDLYLGPQTGKPGKRFVVDLPFVHCTQALNTILKLAEIFDLNEGECIESSFRWFGLRNRRLVSEGRWERDLDSERVAYQDNITVTLRIKRVEKLSELYPLMYSKLLPVYNLFGGFEPTKDHFDKIVKKYFET